LFVEERLQKTIELLKIKKKVTINDLMKEFSVSDVTIRKDLSKLEKQNILQKTHGGAILNESIMSVPSIYQRRVINNQIKEKLGMKAAELIKENEIIMLDSGTTILEIAKKLTKFNDLIVVSNSLDVCVELVNCGGIKVVSTGGIIDKKNLSMRGAAAEQTLSRYKANKAFIGISSLTLKYGFTTSDEQAARVKRKMMESANQVIAVGDSSKFDKVSFAPVCSLDEIDIVITDKNLPKEYMDAFLKKKIQVYLVD
jgi:DeoR/GlpR family transcriptional regulator of sugar metabolism